MVAPATNSEHNPVELATVTDEAVSDISAWMDGTAPTSEAVWKQLQQPEGTQTWALYHLIGDTLRSADAAHRNLEVRDKIMAALAMEPAMIARPKSLKSRFGLPPTVQHYALPGVAAVAAVAMVGGMMWNSSSGNHSTSALSAIAEKPAAVPPVIDNRLAEYVAAHQQYSPVAQFYGAISSDSGILPVAVVGVSSNPIKNDGK